jgi:hypothetical protein
MKTADAAHLRIKDCQSSEQESGLAFEWKALQVTKRGSNVGEGSGRRLRRHAVIVVLELA